MTVTLKAGRIRLTVDRAGANAAAGDYAEALVTDVTRQLFNRANILCPVDTGNLRAHHRLTVTRRPLSVQGQVVNTARYAATVHDGSGPHTIRPRRRKALRFRVDGQVVFARSVRHPGTRARPWLATAGREVAATTGFTWQPA